MKKIYRIITIMLVVGFVSSCDLDLLDNPNAVTPDNASIELLMNNVFIEMADTYVNVTYLGVTDVMTPFVRQSAMQGSQFYAFADGPESYDFIWSQFYATLLPDINVVIEKATADGIPGYSGVAKVLKAYLM